MAKKQLDVDTMLSSLNHPFTNEVNELRKIIKSINPDIKEEWKWNAPSFSYKEYLVTFNLWEKNRIHLVFHNGIILNNKSGLLEGDYKDRRMVYFKDMADIKAKQNDFEDLIKEWIEIMDKN